MAIWAYDENRTQVSTQDQLGGVYHYVRNTAVCEFCGEPLVDALKYFTKNNTLGWAYQSTFRPFLDDHSLGRRPRSTDFTKPEPPPGNEREELFEHHIRICPTCGWWLSFKETVVIGKPVEVRSYGGIGALKLLDLTDVRAPMDEVRRYLVARYDARFSMNPTLFEETVGSVFKGLGYGARVTGRSGDGGIDVILDGPNAVTVGIQVKRYRNKIGVAQIRELTGALVIQGHTKGIFVTTSDFESGAQETATLSTEKGYQIELINAGRFYEALKLAQRASFSTSPQAASPLANVSLRLLTTRTNEGHRPRYDEL